MEKDCIKIWSKCLALIQEQVLPEKFRTLFKPVRALKLRDDVLTIQVPSAYVYEALEGEYIDILRKTLQMVIGPNVKLEYSVVVEKPRTAPPLTTTLSSNPVTKTPVSTVYVSSSKQGGLKNPFERASNQLQIDSQLNPSYSMDSFIVGSCNQIAKSVGIEIAQHPGKASYNPLLIYGGAGLGKTHLAQAIGLEVKRNFPDKVVLYVSTNIFQTQFTEAVRRNEVNDFMHFYQLVDVLILDDIQELAGKTGTQNTFFHIFNHLRQYGKQLILTCDKAPAVLEGMEDRLLSRFRSGLSVEIKLPDFKTRKEIALNKARKEGMDFSEEIIEYICQYVDSNIRELEGAMYSLLAQSTFYKRDLTLDMVRDVLANIVKKPAAEELTVDKIQQVVCEHFKISTELLQTKTRKREVVQARQLAMYFSKNYTKYSLSYIGNQIGKKDHATVLYACKAVADLMDTDRNFKMQVEEIQRKLYCMN
ncbi:MAG: chromosomal replication initiator protein DnaA [Odoribacter sp.]|nr:chromosomal replication initiator protein DnaA [Odoribacter sp.]